MSVTTPCCSVLVPLRVCAHPHMAVSTLAQADTIRGVGVCVYSPRAQLHPVVHTCPPTCGQLQLCVATLPFSHPHVHPLPSGSPKPPIPAEQGAWG